MNREQNNFINEKLHDAFELFVKQEFKETADMTRDEHGVYQNPAVFMMFHVFRGGYWTRQGHILTYGDPALKRLGIRDLNETMELDKQCQSEK